MRNRLEKGKLFKAQRGELFLHVPIGYVKLPSGEVILDPDEQVCSVVQLIFDKFDELGAVTRVFRYLLEHGIRVGVRPIDGPNRGEVEWRRPQLTLLYAMLRHPIFAGTYTYGRCPVDPKRKHTGRCKKGRKWVPPEQWKVVLHDRVPAYITWERYLRNLQRLRQNRRRPDTPGTTRQGAGLLSGLLFCGKCGTRMHVYYSSVNVPRYDCVRNCRHGLKRTCHGMSAWAMDGLVAQLVLSDLARKLNVGVSKVRRWMRHGWVHCRRSPAHGFYILWADEDEIDRLARLVDYAEAHPNTPYPGEITIPKPRTEARQTRKRCRSG
jgi:hypothetical protein